MKRLELILLAGLLGAILYANVSSVSRTVDKLQAQVLRLHILANSDSEEDQALKLAVRDRLLSCSEELFGDAQTLEEAYDAAQSKLDRIREIARQVVQEQGFTYDVEAELVEMPFDERVYEDLTMPAGEYEALRITIGEAEGHNWWCVVFPPLCLSAAEAQETLETLGGDSAQLLAPAEDGGVVFKFRLLELWGELMEYLGLD